MKISIVIPIYNVEKYLSRCLDSVLNQSYDSDYEVICVDDGSTDGSSAILKEYADINEKIKIIRQENRGLSGTRNTGLRAARGQYVWFVDSDDWVSDRALSILHDNANGQDILCFNACMFDDNKNVFIDNSSSNNTQNEFSMNGWEYYNYFVLKPEKIHFVCVWQRLYRREFLLENSLFFEEGIYHEDNLFTPIVCYYAASVKVIPDILYIYRIRQGSITQSINSKRILDTIHVTNRLAKFFIPKDNIDKRAVFKILASDYINFFSEEIFNLYGDKDKEISELVDFEMFRKTAVSPRHRFLYYLIKVSPTLFRAYSKLVKKLRQ